MDDLNDISNTWKAQYPEWDAFVFSYEEGVLEIEEGAESVWFQRTLEVKEAKEVFRVLTQSTTCKKINIGRCNIGKDSAPALAGMLRKNSTLEELHMISNNLGPSGAKQIAKALKINSSLLTLHLHYNDIKDEGANAMGEMLAVNTSLTELNLMYNGISTEGAIDIANGLRENSTLMELRLDNNSIGASGVKMLANSLIKNTSLKFLYLNSTSIDESGGIALWHLIQHNTVIEDLEIGNNRISPSILIKITNKIDVRRYPFKWACDTAIANGDSCKWGRSKLMVIGQGAAGKTSTVRSLLGKPFQPKWLSTVGADATSLAVLERVNATAWKETDARISDLKQQVLRAGAARLKKTTRIKKLELNRNRQHKPAFSFTLSDLIPKRKKGDEETKDIYEFERIEDRTDEEIVAETPSRDHDIMAKLADVTFDAKAAAEADEDRLTFTIWDYGGQKVFYTLHHLFLTEYGVYLVVFDMRSSLKDKNKALEYLRFWLYSVRLHASAPIILVGTRMDSIYSKKAYKDINQMIQKLLQKSFVNIIENTEGLLFFPVDNKNAKGIEELRSVIEATARSQDYVKQPVSLRWMKFLDEMIEHKDVAWLPLSQVEEIAQRNGVKRVKQALQFFHELGVIVHLTATEELRKTVTIDPQWLLDAFTQVIRDDIHVTDTLETVGLGEEFQRLRLEGIASIDILEYLWRNSKVEFLIDLMSRTLLISQWKFGDREETMYLVPSLFLKENEKLEKDTTTFDGRTCRFDFSILIQSNDRAHFYISGRLPGSKKPLLGPHHAIIYFGETRLLLRELQRMDSIELCIDQKHVSSAPKTLKAINFMLVKLKEDVMGNKFAWDVQIQDDNGNTYISTKGATAKDMEEHKIWFEADLKGEKNVEVKGVDLDSFLESIS